MSSDTIGRGIQIIGSVAGFVPGIGWALRAGIVIGSSLLGGYLRSRGAEDAADIERGVRVNAASNEAAIPVIYGRTKVGAALMDVRLNTASSNDEELYVTAALALGPEDGSGIEAVDDIYLDDKLAIASPVFENEPRIAEVTSDFELDGVNKLEYGLHAGADSQVVDADLDAVFAAYGSTDAGVGVAYVTLVLKYAPEIYRGIPQITAVVQGQKVYDPRGTPGWSWSDNPALCILDYLTSKRYGCQLQYSERDGGSRSEIDEQSFIDAANYCDELVSTPAGNQKRFTCNGRLDTEKPLWRNLEELLSSCRGELIYEGGKFRLHIRQATTPETLEITDDIIVGDVEYWRGGVESSGNRVISHFVDSDNGWLPQEAVWPEADQANSFLTNDADFENPLEVHLPFTDDFYRAQQIGMVALRESREDRGISCDLHETALQFRVGDVVRVTHERADLDQDTFWVRAMVLNPDDTIRVMLSEYDVGAYSLDTLNTRDTLTASSLPDANTVEVPTSVTFLADSSTSLEVQNGAQAPRGKLSWTRSAHPFLSHYEVQFKLDAEPSSSYRSAAPDPLREDTEVWINGLTDGAAIDIRIRAVSTVGNKPSAWVELTSQPVASADYSLGSGLQLDGGQIALDLGALTDPGETMTALDRFAYEDDSLGGVSRKIAPVNIPLSLFTDDITGALLETASTGLTTVGSDVQANYAGGAGSLIGAAADGTGLGTLGTSDRILFADFSDSFNVKFADLDQLPFETNLTAGAGLGRSGDTLSVNVGDGIQIASDAVALDLVDLVLTATNPDRTADHLVFNDASAPDAPRRILFQNVGLSVFDNDAGFSADALETAGAGLIESPAGTVAVDYSGADNIILSNAGGSLAGLADADRMLINDASDNVVHSVALSVLESFWSIGAPQITAGTFGAGGYTFPALVNINNSGANGFRVRRSSSNGEAMLVSLEDAITNLHYTNDESGARFRLRIENTDTESGGGASANNEFVDILGDTAGIRIQPSTLGNQTNPTYGWQDDPDTGLYLAADGTLAFTAAGVRRLDLDSIDATHGRFRFDNGQVYSAEGPEITRATAGAVTLDWDAYDSVPLRNDGNIDTINIDDGSMQNGGRYELVVRFATGGQASITFAATGTLIWQFGDTPPTMPTGTVGDRLTITFVRTDGITLGYYAAAEQ